MHPKNGKEDHREQIQEVEKDLVKQQHSEDTIKELKKKDEVVLEREKIVQKETITNPREEPKRPSEGPSMSGKFVGTNPIIEASKRMQEECEGTMVSIDDNVVELEKCSKKILR